MLRYQRSRLGSHRTSVAVTLLVVGAGVAGTAVAQSHDAALAPVIAKSAAAVLQDQYIVVMVPGTSANAVAAAASNAKTMGATIGFTYTAAIAGFSVTAAPAVLDKLRAISGVSYIEPDAVVTASTVQVSPPLGLDRTSERLLPLNNMYTYSQNGTGVHAYVIDTGIRATHTQLYPRVTGGFTAISTGGTNDCNGHGTHVAGTIGGTTYGIAKNVNLHPVRVLDCTGSGTVSGVIAGVNWVTANAVHPAVANMSLGGAASTSLDAAVTSSIASGITYAIAAGNSAVNACTQSPADVPAAITVGSINPTNDTRSSFSNYGPCLDLFAPGESIVSSWYTSDTATNTLNGTSMATPHVAGVAALYLQGHVAANPATVLAAIHNAADVSTTFGWPGIINPGAGSPNELLHWGSLNTGHDDGDPHLVNASGVAMDFQSAGEFVLLRDGNGTEIQTRQTPVETTTLPITNGYTGLTSCVSLNTAVAARVGSHRVSYEPNVSGVPDPSGLQLRIDGVLTTLPTSGANLGPGGHVTRAAGGTLTVDFPDGTQLVVQPSWWSSESRWYLNVTTYHTTASDGIDGVHATGSWLPALPGGGSMGAMPATLHQRYVDLNTTWANAWRVTSSSSLFDYAAGTSTATFTIPSWPPESGACELPDSDTAPVEPLDPKTAQAVCAVIKDATRRGNCISDVTVTGEIGFAAAHQATEALDLGSTQTQLDDTKAQTAPGEATTFTATIVKNAARDAIPTGTVQFTLDGKDVGATVKLDGNGQAVWANATLEAGTHTVGARYAPTQGSVFQASTSLDVTHTVKAGQ